jgi:ABC-2 type transport system ATP-binding protein
MDEAIITTKELIKEFKSNGRVRAVDGVTLQINRGDVFGMIGPDGAGKTTLTRVILGLLSRTGGESSILGFDSMKNPYAIRERVGYVAQLFALPPELTVMENMHFFADIQGVPLQSQKQRIGELLDFTGLVNFTGRKTRQLSGGMKKKLALSCSLIHEPDVLMLDEPTLGVDPVSRREFWAMLSLLRAERGMTIFVCTPYMDEAERCNRIGLIYKGRIIAHDTPEQIKRLAPGMVLEFSLDQSRFDEAMAAIKEMQGVCEVQTYGAMLHVFVDNIEQRQSEIETYLTSQGIAWGGMRVIEPRMEEAFISLINRQHEAAASESTGESL